MGDRVLFQVRGTHYGKEVLSPSIYCHNEGGASGEICRRVKARMSDRSYDVAYTAARILQEAIANYPDGNLSFGIQNESKLLTADDSPGDAGVVIVHVADSYRAWRDAVPEMRFECFGGYLVLDAEGFPVSKYRLVGSLE